MPTGNLQRAFGRNLREYRRRLGYSQERFAEEMGIHRTYMGGMERGERNLSLQTIEYYCALFDLDPLQMLSPSYPFEE